MIDTVTFGLQLCYYLLDVHRSSFSEFRKVYRTRRKTFSAVANASQCTLCPMRRAVAKQQITYGELIEALGVYSDRISTQVRTLGIGILAVLWAIWTGDSATSHQISSFLGWHARVIAILAAASVIVDFLQYVCGYLNLFALKSQMEISERNDAPIDYSTVLFRCQTASFYVKQILVGVCAVWLLLDLGMFLSRGVANPSTAPAAIVEKQQPSKQQSPPEAIAHTPHK